jgi:hypothetical protein
MYRLDWLEKHQQLNHPSHLRLHRLANNTAINLSAIGTGGFVINGENEMEWSGYSASTAGDVNGDGLDDLIVGAFQANLNGTYGVGKSYVIVGKAVTTAINLSSASILPLRLALRAPIIKSSKPSPLTSPAVETE